MKYPTGLSLDVLEQHLESEGFIADVDEIVIKSYQHPVSQDCHMGLVIGTWNRPDYLRQMLDALSISKLDNCLVLFIDDASDDSVTRSLLLEVELSAPTAVIFKRERSNINRSLDIGWSTLKSMGCTTLVNLDSDALVKPNWLNVIKSIHDKLEYPQDKVIVSGFNRHIHSSITADHGDYVVKSQMGGINYYFDVSAFAVIKPFLNNPHWDSLVQDYFSANVEDGFKMVAAKPSVVQHIGKKGLNSNGVEYDYAVDFYAANEHEKDASSKKKSVSCLLTFYDDGSNRIENLYYVINNLASNSGFEIVLVEQGTTPCVDPAQLPNNCIYKFVDNKSLFNKSWGLNIAANLSKGKILLVHDADLILDVTQLLYGIELLEDDFCAINPYDMLVDLSQEETKSLLENDPDLHISRTESEINRGAIEQTPPFCGGAFIIRRDVYFAVGGMDERFSGWGAEDDAMSLRILNYSSRNRELKNSMAYHLWHGDFSQSNKQSGPYISNFAYIRSYYELGKSFINAFKKDFDTNADEKKYADVTPTEQQTALPMVTCLCVTRNRVALLKKSIDCFQRQTYPNRELLIVCEDDDPETINFLRQFEGDDIRYHIASTRNKMNLGQLRNLSVSLANGDYFCQWDDDDWFHPRRISKQMEFLLSNKKSASILARWFIYSSAHDTAYLSPIRMWEGSLLCKVDTFSNKVGYDELDRGEDTLLIRDLILSDALTVMDAPELYTYYHSGDNTWHESHFNHILVSSTPLDDDLQALVKTRFRNTDKDSATSVIPKIIHQTAASENSIPKAYQKLRTVMLEQHQDWQYYFYDDTDCRRVVADNMPELLDCYDGLPLNIQRADLFRLVAVYLYGGFYVDLDIDFMQPLDDLLDHPCVFAEELTLTDQQQKSLGHQHKFRVANYMFGAEPGHPFIRSLISAIANDVVNLEVSKEEDVLQSTGPGMVTAQYHNYADKDSITMLSNNGQVCEKCETNSCSFGDYASHLHMASWRWHDKTDNEPDEPSKITKNKHNKKIIHQTWKNTRLPDQLRQFSDTWTEHNPKWHRVLWTDADNRNLIETHYSWFLETYDAYPTEIQRVDAARYFILYSLGGLYVDLDFRCIKPMDELVEGHEIVLGLEHDNHGDWHGKEQIVGNAFMYAEEPGHPFLRQLIEELAVSAASFSSKDGSKNSSKKTENSDVLESTGPFLLSKVYQNYADKDSITLLPSNYLYPIDSDEGATLLQNKALDKKFREKTDAYAVHYHYGSWWK